MIEQKSATWSWGEEPELYEDGIPTGLTILVIPTVATPEGYRVAVAGDTSDFARAATVQSLWDNQGRPV